MTPAATPDGAPSHIHVPSLAVAVAIMFACTLYPPMMTDAAGNAEHGLAIALFVAMSAGLVRGVGFIPHVPIWRWMFSGWTCLAALALACAMRLLH